MPEGFYWGDGWSMKRDEDEAVLITYSPRNALEPGKQFRLSAGEWATALNGSQVPMLIVEFISKRGELVKS